MHASRLGTAKLAAAEEGAEVRKAGFLFKQHATGLWGRCWATTDGETVKWWAAKDHGAGGAIDWSGPPKRVVPLAHCVFGWRGKTERRAMLSKAFPRMYTENEANARLQPWLPKGTPKL